MSESIAPKPAQNDDENSEQQDSSERVKIASDTRVSTRPPKAQDDDWLDGLSTVPAPRESKSPDDAPNLAAPAPPSEPIVPVPIVNVAAENPAPVPRVSKAERRRRKKKKAPAVAAQKPQKPQRSAPVPVQDPTPSESSSAGPWLLLAAVVGTAGLWFLSGAGRDEALPNDEPAAVTPQVAEVKNPVPPIAPSEPARVEQAAPPPAPAPATQPEPTALPEKVEAAPSESAGEPARVGAFKAVVEASKNARTCRHRGDAPARVPVIVEFGVDGRVQRTDIKAKFANPMTSRCISSRLGAATIPAFDGAPILITGEVSLR
jgi:hypothetical protein